MKKIWTVFVLCTLIASPSFAGGKTYGLEGGILGFVAGALVGGTAGFFLGYTLEEKGDGYPVQSAVVGSAVGVGVGGTAGAILGNYIGSKKEKKKNISVLPYVAPTKNGVDAGARLQISF